MGAGMTTVEGMPLKQGMATRWLLWDERGMTTRWLLRDEPGMMTGGYGLRVVCRAKPNGTRYNGSFGSTVVERRGSSPRLLGRRREARIE